MLDNIRNESRLASREESAGVSDRSTHQGRTYTRGASVSYGITQITLLALVALVALMRITHPCMEMDSPKN